MKSFNELTGIKIANPEIIETTSKVVVIVGCPGLGDKSVDVFSQIYTEIETANPRTPMCIDTYHPKEQNELVKTMFECLDEDALPQDVLLYTVSPFVLKTLTAYYDRSVLIYECSINKTGTILTLSKARDVLTAYDDMLASFDDFEYTEKCEAHPQTSEEKEKYFIKFTKKIGLWMEDIELDGVRYSMHDDVTVKDVNELWGPIINSKDEIELIVDTESGEIINWPKGMTASFTHVKIDNTGHYELLDAQKNVVKYIYTYVPHFFQIETFGYGNYLEFEVEKDGHIKNWKIDLAEFCLWDKPKEEPVHPQTSEEKADSSMEKKSEAMYIRFSKDIGPWVQDVKINGLHYSVGKYIDRNCCKSIVDDDGVMELIIDIHSGNIINWPKGLTGSFRSVKIVDTGHYDLLDAQKNVLTYMDDYVPDFFQIEENGYGDYLEFEVENDGHIKNWKFGESHLNNCLNNWQEPDEH